MTQHYSTKDFFRQMPNTLLGRYFHGREVFTHLDFSEKTKLKTDELFAAWLDLPGEQRKAMDAELQNINEMSCQKGYLAIIDDARWQWRQTPERLPPFVAMLSALPNHYARAMVTILDHKEFWKGATRFYHADTLAYCASVRICPTNRQQLTMPALSN